MNLQQAIEERENQPKGFRIWTPAPFKKENLAVRIIPGGGIQPPTGFVEFAALGDIDQWIESFNDKADPVQALIDYVSDLLTE